MKQANLNCLIGDTVYKMCPKCNPDHNGTCQNCAWGGCYGPCNIDPYVYNDGSFNEKKKQVVALKVYERTFIHINEWWNIGYFGTREECEKAIEEFEAICAIENRAERKAKYDEWRAQRDTNVMDQLQSQSPQA